MIEGSYEECWKYIERMAYTDRDHVTVIHAASADAAGNMISSFNNWLLVTIQFHP